MTAHQAIITKKAKESFTKDFEANPKKSQVMKFVYFTKCATDHNVQQFGQEGLAKACS